MKDFGYSVVSQILSGASVRDAVLESIRLSESTDYEQIDSEPTFLGFNRTIAAFAPDVNLTSATPVYKGYSFKVYCPDLIGERYDADDPHPYEVTVYVEPDSDVYLDVFSDALDQSFKNGTDIRKSIPALYSGDAYLLKAMKFKPLWR